MFFLGAGAGSGTFEKGAGDEWGWALLGGQHCAAGCGGCILSRSTSIELIKSMEMLIYNDRCVLRLRRRDSLALYYIYIEGYTVRRIVMYRVGISLVVTQIYSI